MVIFFSQSVSTTRIHICIESLRRQRVLKSRVRYMVPTLEMFRLWLPGRASKKKTFGDAGWFAGRFWEIAGTLAECFFFSPKNRRGTIAGTSRGLCGDFWKTVRGDPRGPFQIKSRTELIKLCPWHGHRGVEGLFGVSNLCAVIVHL